MWHVEALAVGQGTAVAVDGAGAAYCAGDEPAAAAGADTVTNPAGPYLSYNAPLAVDWRSESIEEARYCCILLGG